MGFSPEINAALATMSPAERASTSALLKEQMDVLRRGNAAAEARVRAMELRQAQYARPPTKQGGLLRGMKPTTAIVGAVALGAVAYGALKLMDWRREPAPQNPWSQRIEQERARAAQQSAQRGS